MLNPVLNNFRVDFGDNFFPDFITKKYDTFLFHKNTPFKSIRSHFYESIQQVNMPGLNLQTMTVPGMENTGRNPRNPNNPNGFPHTTNNRHYPGTQPFNEIVDGIVFNITMRNSILNWMYCYEVLYRYYKRTRDISEFQIMLTMMDSAEIPMIRFKLSDCFVSIMPGLEFAYNQSFSESKTFDCGFTFNEFDVEFLVPNFDLREITL